MIRVNYHLTHDQVQRLSDESDRTGVPVAELIRRAIDALYPPAIDTEVRPLHYKGYVGIVRAGAERRERRWRVVFKCDARSPCGKHDLHAEAETIADLRRLFESSVDEQIKMLGIE